MPFTLLPEDQPGGGFKLLADPKIGQPEDLTFAEKYVAPLLEKTGLGDVAGGNVRGSAAGRVAMGLADPGVALTQLAANAVSGDTDTGDIVNKRIQDVEQQYQAARKEAGSEGFDPLRLLGNVGMTVFAGAAAPGSLPEQLGTYGKAAIQGAGYSALQPVSDGGDFWKEKGKQAIIGGIAGPLTAAAGAGVARLVSPRASVNPDVTMLQEAGVRPSIGQTLGGWANTLEEKAMSLPILGDAIAAARRRGVKDFNGAVLNTATGPIGQKASGVGFEGVADAGNKLRGAYNQAAQDVGHVNLADTSFNAKFGELMDLVSSPGALTPDLQSKFQNVVKNEVLRRMSPNGSVAGENIKAIDSTLGKIAADYRASSTASEREFGSAIKQLQQAFRDGLAEASPAYDTARQAADQGWRAFRLARNAAAAAKNREGVFTPAQFNSAIQQDAGKAAVGEGRAFMQDAGQAAQNVLGNKYPDSGTAGRVLVNMAALPFHYGTGGATALGLGAGAAAYTPQVQNLLRFLVTQRPDAAPQYANELRRLIQAGGAGVTVPLVESMTR